MPASISTSPSACDEFSRRKPRAHRWALRPGDAVSAEAAPGRRDGSLVGAATEAISSQNPPRRAHRGRQAPDREGIGRAARRLANGAARGPLQPRGPGAAETRGTRGRFVAAGGSSERSRTLVGAWLHQHAGEILEVDEIRSVLEAHAIRSMSRWDAIDAAQEAGAAARLQAEALERGDPLAAADGDATFHRTLCSYTKNHALRTLVDGLIDASRKGAYAVYSLPDTAAGSARAAPGNRRGARPLRRRSRGATRPGAHARRGAPLLGHQEHDARRQPRDQALQPRAPSGPSCRGTSSSIAGPASTSSSRRGSPGYAAT